MGDDAAAQNELRVREAARSCLAALQEQMEQDHVRQTLLRPAADPNAPADILLRPAQGVAEADPQALLRPSAEDES